MIVKDEEKAQGSLEYLLIMAAVLAIAVVVVVVANSLVGVARNEVNQGADQFTNALNEMRGG